MFHQSGGCCDGSAPMCYPDGDFQTGGSDVQLGDLHVDGLDEADRVLDVGVAVRVLAAHPPHRRRGEGPGQRVLGGGAEGVRFLIRSRLFTDEEWMALQEH